MIPLSLLSTPPRPAAAERLLPRGPEASNYASVADLPPAPRRSPAHSAPDLAPAVTASREHKGLPGDAVAIDIPEDPDDEEHGHVALAVGDGREAIAHEALRLAAPHAERAQALAVTAERLQRRIDDLRFANGDEQVVLRTALVGSMAGFVAAVGLQMTRAVTFPMTLAAFGGLTVGPPLLVGGVVVVAASVRRQAQRELDVLAQPLREARDIAEVHLSVARELVDLEAGRAAQ